MTLLYKIKYYSAFLFAFFLPIKLNLSNIFLGLFIFVSIIEIILLKKYYFNTNRLKYSLLIYFIIQLIGLIYTPFLDIGLHSIEQNIAFFIVPIVFSLLPKNNKKIILRFIKNGLIIGTLFALIILISNTLNIFIINRENKIINILNFNYTRANFTNILKIHPSYLGVFIVFSSVLINSFYYNDKINKYFYFFTMLIFFIGVIFINQRIIFFIYFTLLLFFIIQKMKKYYSKKAHLKLGVFIVVLSTLILFSYPYIKESYIYYRFTKELKWELSEEKNSFYIKNSKAKSDSRMARWKEIIHLVKKKPYIGYGTGSEKNVLAEMFKSKGMINSFNSRYDSHNQYLSILIEHGLIGFLFFIFILISNIYLSIKDKNIEFSILIFVFLIIGIVENYLTRNAGITFFTFFTSAYLFDKKTKNED